MRNHYDLGRRTNRPQPPAPEPEDGPIGLNRRKFPLWITVFFFSLLLGIGTAVYAVTAFNSSPSRPGDTILADIAGSRASGETTGTNDGPTPGEGEADTPPVWEDFPADPNPVLLEPDKPSDTQQTNRQDSATRKTAGKKNGLLLNRPPSLLGDLGKKRVNREPAPMPAVPKDFTTDPPAIDRGDSENPAPTFQNLRVIEGYPFWRASQVGNATTGDEHPDEVNLFGYVLQPDGSVNSMTQTGEMENVEDVLSARRAGVPVVPIVTANFVPDRFHDLLADPEKRTQTADNLVKWAGDRDFDGIDILLGSVDQAARENLSLFIEELAEKMHKENKRLGIRIHPEMTASLKDWSRWVPSVDQWRMITRLPVGMDSDMEEFVKQIRRHLTLLKKEVPEEKVHLLLPLHGTPGPSGEAPFLQDPARAAGDQTAMDDDAMIEHYQTLIRDVLENHPAIGGILLWHSGGSENPEIREIIRLLKSNRSVKADGRSQKRAGGEEPSSSQKAPAPPYK